MIQRLSGKVAIVTGAASGIGRASAALFVAEGAAVIAADVTAGDGIVRADAGREEDVRGLVDKPAHVLLAPRIGRDDALAFAHVRSDDRTPFAPEPRGRRLADARGGAGDDGNFALKPHRPTPTVEPPSTTIA